MELFNFILFVHYSTQHSTTYIKKLIEDSSTMDERIRMERFQFLAVGHCSQNTTYLWI